MGDRILCVLLRPCVTALCLLLVLLPSAQALFTNGVIPDSKYQDMGAGESAVAYVEIRASEDSKQATGFTAALIAPDLLLTAAHTLIKYLPKTPGPHSVTGRAIFKPVIKVVSPAEIYEIDQVIMHPAYPGNMLMDFGVIRLKRPVEGISPIALYDARTPEQGGQNLSFLKKFEANTYGYGRTVNGASDGYRRGASFPQVTKMATDRLLVGLYPSPPKEDIISGVIERSQGRFTPKNANVLLEKANDFKGKPFGLLAPGDSGGPLIARLNGVETIVGVNKNSVCDKGMKEHLDDRNRPIFTSPKDAETFYFRCQSGFSLLFDPETGVRDPALDEMINALRSASASSNLRKAG